jgi:hypothetical protein
MLSGNRVPTAHTEVPRKLVLLSPLNNSLDCAMKKEADSHDCQLLVSSSHWFKLTFTYPEYFSTTHWACTLGCGLAVLHGYCFRILHLPLSSAFYTVCLHCLTSISDSYVRYNIRDGSVNSIIILLLEGTTGDTSVSFFTFHYIKVTKQAYSHQYRVCW